VVSDARLVERAEVIRDKGTNRSRFLRGEVDMYTWSDLGSSYLPSDLLAAFLYAQLESLNTIRIRRRRIWQYYHHHLLDWAQSNLTQLPYVPPDCDPLYQMFYLLLPSWAHRQAFVAHMRGRGIMCAFPTCRFTFLQWAKDSVGNGATAQSLSR